MVWLDWLGLCLLFYLWPLFASMFFGFACFSVHASILLSVNRWAFAFLFGCLVSCLFDLSSHRTIILKTKVEIAVDQTYPLQPPYRHDSDKLWGPCKETSNKQADKQPASQPTNKPTNQTPFNSLLNTHITRPIDLQRHVAKEAIRQLAKIMFCLFVCFVLCVVLCCTL